MREVLIRQTKRASDPQRAVSLMCDCSRSEYVQHTNTDQRWDVKCIYSSTEEEDEDGYIRNKYKRFIFWVINCSVSKIAAWISWIKSSESFFWSRSESWYHQQQAPEQQTTKSKYVYSVKVQKYLFESVKAAHVKQTSPSIKFTIRELKTLQVLSWKQLS